MLPVVRYTFALISAFLLHSPCNAAELTWEHLLPSGTSRGQEVKVEIRGGKFDNWPIKIWADTPYIEVRALEEKGRLSVKVSPECPAGVHALRLFDNTTATPLRPFLISESVEVNENEPNDRTSEARLFKETTVINGAFEKVGDADTFAVELEGGGTVVASMIANQVLESQVDAVLQVITPEGFIVAQNHDWRGLDPRVVFTAKKAGRYLVRCFTFPSKPDPKIRLSGMPAWIYRLTLTTDALVDYAYPLTVEKDKPAVVELVGWNLGADQKELTLEPELLVRAPRKLELWRPELATPINIDVVPHPTLTEPTEPAAEPQPFSLPCSITGTLAQPGQIDRFSFDGKKDQLVRLEILARRMGSPIDAFLTLKGPDGKNVEQVDDSAGKDAIIQKPLPADGKYTVELEDRHLNGGERYVYVLTATIPQPDFDISTPKEVLSLEAGKSLSVEVTVSRQHGIPGFIEITAVDLPEGVHVDRVTSMGEGESAKKVTLTLTADEGVTASGPFRIVGKATEHDSLEKFVRSSRSWMPESAPHLWVTVVPAAPEAESKKK